MDVELAEGNGGPSGIVDNSVPINISSSSHIKPTSWAYFLSIVSNYRAVFLFLFLAVLFASAGVGVYYSTIQNGWINIHLVPHTHDDVGWLRTPENYYEYSVKYILNNVIHELQKDPQRKFVFVETYFFWRWWNQQSNTTHDIVRSLVENGQLEFAGGGWSMNDEATAHYQNIIDQFTWGLRRLNDTLGSRALPKVAWQIDTFGHSREMASLAVLMGFEGMFFARMDEEERSQRRDRRAMEFLWEDRDGATSILTSVLFKHYNPPSGYDYEEEANEGANLDGFLEAVRQWADAYQTHNVLIPMGDDFTYYDARTWFDNMDSLIRQVEERKDSGINVNLFYSTPTQYLQAIQDTSADWPVKRNGDFFPYSSDIFSYWTGYFSSRPSLKLYERTASNFMQMTKQLLSLSGDLAGLEERLTGLREALGILIHHDALPGTAKQGVTDHYIDILHRALIECLYPVNEAIRGLSFGFGKSEPIPHEPCLLLNMSVCLISERSTKFTIMAYNTLSWPVSRAIRVPVLATRYSVLNANGDALPTQLVPLPPEVIALPGRTNTATHELVFLSGLIPPLGFMSFYISVQNKEEQFYQPENEAEKYMKLSFDQFTGRLSGVAKNDVSISVQQDLEYYYGSSFWTGAYIFRPSDPYPYKMGGLASNILASTGPIVEETHQSIGPWSSQVFRSYKGAPYLEIEWLVGPIPIEDYHGKEVIVLYTSKIKSGGIFYTDTNGRGTLRRVRDRRDDWVYTPHEIVSGNYYPVTSHISVRNSSSQMFVLTDRAQGGSSIRDGQVELMVHRRLCYDDGKGVNEALNETEFGEGLVVRGRHWLIFGDDDPTLEQTVKRLGMELQSEPFLLLAPTDLNFLEWQQTQLNLFGGLSSPLPPNVRILTLEPWRDNLILLRLEHMYEKNSALPLSKPASVKLRNLLNTFEIVGARETMLGADRWMYPDRGWLYGDLSLVLQPASIRTYLVQINRLLPHP